MEEVEEVTGVVCGNRCRGGTVASRFMRGLNNVLRGSPSLVCLSTSLVFTFKTNL